MNAEYIRIIGQFRSKRILVLGDFILDVYLKGTSTRLSPEAPVPVVDVEEKRAMMGGAANAALNLKSLGAEVTFLSVVGIDEEGEKAIRLVQQAGIDPGRMIRNAGRKTITKTRVMAGTHVVTRYDYGTETDISNTVEHILIRHLRTEFERHDAIVISDYSKGVITPAVLDALLELQARHQKFIAVDSKRLSFFRMLQPTLVKPNYEEAVKLLGLPYLSTSRAEQIQAQGVALSEATAAVTSVVTLDEDGAVVFEKDQFVSRVCAHPVLSPNVAGAGDTFISTFTLVRLSHGDLKSAADLSCAAAAIAIRKEATASCSMKELRAYFEMNEKQISSTEELAQLCSLYRGQGKRIVFTNGCFDILHSGHVSYLNRARQLGDVLIVGINRDESIRRIKGASRPINPLNDRMQVLSALSSITHLVAFGTEKDDTPIPLIKIVRPEIFVKGGDYTRDKLPEAETVEQAGGEVVFLSLVPDHSTSQIIEQIHKTSSLAMA